MNRKARTYLFYLGHPAHFHNVKNLSKMLIDRGDHVQFIARKKDVLYDLLLDSPVPTHYLSRTKKEGRVGQLLFILYRFIRMTTISFKVRPDIIVGTDVVITWIATLLRLPSVILNEDDIDQVPLLKYGLKFCTASIAPSNCRHGEYAEKHWKYTGIQESSYLNPSVFTPDQEICQVLSPDGLPYFILRFASLSAHHDDGKRGISDQEALQLVSILQKKGLVYITSERALAPELESLRISIDPRQMHSALYYAEMYIGDSQTMAAESALLGTPSLRYNDFVGKLSYLDFLQNEYSLTQGVPVGSFVNLINIVHEWGQRSDLKSSWQLKANKFFDSTDDVNEVWIAFLDDIIGEELAK